MDEERNKRGNGADMPSETGEMAAIKKERDEYLAGWQRAKADLINYKKDELHRMEDVARYGNEGLIREIITVMDDFDLALRVMEKNGGADGVDRGIYLIRSKVEDVLKKRGVEKIAIRPGDGFDPMVAEAMAEIPSDHPPGAIVEEIEPGYRLHDKVLRPARVIISKGNEIKN